MVIHDCLQNSEHWMDLRRGLPTASEFSRIVKPSEGTLYLCQNCGAQQPRKRKTCAVCSGTFIEAVMAVQPSAQQDGYIFQLIAESMGAVTENVPNRWMDRGHELEPMAIATYEAMTGNDTERVGFCVTDDGLLGASPDRLVVGKKRVVEAKCPSPAVHVQHLVTGDLESSHKVQVQAQLLVTGYEGADVVSFCPGFPTVIIEVERNESYISGMNVILVEFVTKLHRTRAEIIAKYGDFRAIPIPVAVAEEDAAASWLEQRAF